MNRTIHFDNNSFIIWNRLNSHNLKEQVSDNRVMQILQQHGIETLQRILLEPISSIALKQSEDKSSTVKYANDVLQSSLPTMMFTHDEKFT